MKIKKVLIFITVFCLGILLLTINSYGFNKGDKVVTNKKSYIYKPEYSQGNNVYLKGYKRDESEHINKNVELEYVQNMNKDGICKVLTKGADGKPKECFIKEVNLDAYKKEIAEDNVAKELVDKYKNYNEFQFQQLGKDKLKSESDLCIKAMKSTTDSSLKLALGGIINKMATAAENLGMDVKADKTIDYEIPAPSTVPSGDQVYDEMLNEEKEEIEENAPVEGEVVDKDTPIYKKPSINKVQGTEKSFDDMVSDADDFINDSEAELKYNDTALQNFSKSLFNISTVAGIIVAVIVGGIIGIKLMSSNIETQVQAKKLIVPYVVGCVTVFGGFVFWKILVDILQSV